jgi:transcriptional regulator with XRE-family HTH domain
MDGRGVNLVRQWLDILPAKARAGRWDSTGRRGANLRWYSELSRKGSYQRGFWRQQMITGGSFFQQAGLGSVDTGSMRAEALLDSLRSSKEYREAFVAEAIQSRITGQIAALRDRAGWDYKAFAEKLNKKLSWTYRLEDPNLPPPTISTLLDVAAAFDIGLDVRFCRFSELLHDVSSLSPESFAVPRFDEELKSGSLVGSRRKRNVRSNRHHRAKSNRINPAPLAEFARAQIGSSRPPHACVA